MVSSSVSHLLSTKNIPQVSYASTSPSLSDNTIFPNFLRTVPSDLQQIEAIVKLLQHFNWTYISAFAEDDDYGRLAIDIFRDKVRLVNICLAVDMLFDTTLEKAKNELEKKYNKTQVVVMWCSSRKAVDFIRKSESLKNILWIIGTETVAVADDIKNARLDAHVITLRVAEYPIASFINHMNRLGFKSPLNNTWLTSMWRSLGYCPDNPRDDCLDSQPSGRILQTAQHENIMAAVYALAYGLHSMLECDTNPSHCYQNINSTINNENLLSFMHRRDNFVLPDSSLVIDFDVNGDVKVNKYQLLYLRNRKKINIGVWDGKEKLLEYINESILWSNYKSKNQTKPKSTCAYPCKPGTYKYEPMSICCWECIPCPQDAISTQVDANQCTTCQETQTSNSEHTKCLPLQNKALTLTSEISRPLLGLSALGIMLTFIVMICFFKYWNTPLVKSSSREMSLIQLISMVILFSLPVLDMLPLTTYLCILKTIIFGIFHTLIIAFIFTKTYRLFKVFQPARFTKVSKYFHNRYQVLPSIALVFLQMAVFTVWYSVHLPSVTLFVDRSGGSYVYYCDYHEQLLHYAIVGYIILMSLLTGYMGFRARKLPSNFNEAQFIWLAMFTSCLAWICFYALHLSAKQWDKPLIFLYVNLVSTFVMLAILYGYKLRILLFYPQLNSQEHFSKLAANATVKTFMKDINPANAARFNEQQQSHQQSVISFDFDGMFDEYKKNKRRKSTFRDNFHFPTAKDIRKSFKRKKRDSTKSQRKTRRKTTELKNKNIEKAQKRRSFSDTIQPSTLNEDYNKTMEDNDSVFTIL